MAIHRGVDDMGPFREEPTAHLEERRRTRSSRIATGTLACPQCDAPALLPSGFASPRDELACAFCGHDGAVRDFLSLTPPTRPTRVVVRVVPRARPAER